MGPRSEETDCKVSVVQRAGNVYLVPCINTITTLPWLGKGVKRVGEITWTNGTPTKLTP